MTVYQCRTHSDAVDIPFQKSSPETSDISRLPWFEPQTCVFQSLVYANGYGMTPVPICDCLGLMKNISAKRSLTTSF
eukprot:53730-Eustigmatos_ZCMA.PRE.1